MFGICHKSSRLLERSFTVDLIQGAYMRAWNVNKGNTAVRHDKIQTRGGYL
jgi:hypothetical protein